MTRVPQKSCGALYRQFVKHSAVYVKIDLEGNQWVLGWCLRTQTLWHDSIVRKTDFKLTQNYRAYFRLLSICRVGTYFFFQNAFVLGTCCHRCCTYATLGHVLCVHLKVAATRWQDCMKTFETYQNCPNFGKVWKVHGDSWGETQWKSFYIHAGGSIYIYTHTKFHLYIYTNVHL